MDDTSRGIDRAPGWAVRLDDHGDVGEPGGPGGSRRGRRRRRAVALALLVAVVAGVVLLATDPFAWLGKSPHQSAGTGTSVRLSSTQGPPVPAHGAYVGAWVKPDQYTDVGRMAAVRRFEQRLGRRLDVVHVYHTWDDPYPSSTDLAYLRDGRSLLLSWAGTDTRTIISGRYDSLIRQRADAVKAIGRPIFLEWRWEMDRPNLSASVWSPQDYIAAWKHIRTIFAQEGVRNAGWVWCPTAAGFEEGRAGAYYPGDAQVDWICVDAYPGKDYRAMSELLDPFLTWAAGHPKPIMIGEFGVPRNGSSDRRAGWLRDAAQTFRTHPQIRAVLYFDANPAGHTDAGSYVLDDDPPALQAFRDLVVERYFNPRRVPVSTG